MAVNTVQHRVDSRLRYYVNQWNKSHDGRSKITEAQMLVLQAYLASPDKEIKLHRSAAYRSIYTNCSFAAARVMSHRLFNKPKIMETLEKVLQEEGVTQRSVIQDHKEIIKEAKKAKQFSAALKGNEDFMELTGLKKKDAPVTNNFNLNIKNVESLSGKELNEKLEELLNLDVSDAIEGEFEELEQEKIGE